MDLIEHKALKLANYFKLTNNLKKMEQEYIRAYECFCRLSIILELGKYYF